MTIPTNPAPNEEWTNDATGVTYVWDGERWFIKPGEKEDLVTQDEFEQDQKRQDDDIEAGFDTQGQILIKNIEQDNQLGVHSNQINALETQVQLLAKASGGVWRYERNVSGTSPRPPGSSRFYGTHTAGVDTVLTNWSDLRLLMVNKSDINGTDFVFTNFEVGDRVEIIATDASSLCIGTIETAATQDSYGNMIVSPDRTNGGPEEGKEYLISVFRPGEEGGSSIDTDILDQRYYKKTGGTITGSFSINRGEKPHPQYKITGNGGDNYATNIYTLGNGDMRLRTSHTSSEEDHVGSHIVLIPNNGDPQTKIYNVVEAGENTAVPRSYVDEKVASGGVPVGSIMIWMNSTVPDGWFKLQGGSFSTSEYPQLHAYLQSTSGYTSGKLPNWSGYYPGEYGDHLTHDLGSKQGYKTGKPSGGAPKTSNDIPNGNTRTFNATGGTNAYSDGKGKAVIDSGWDSTTRPKTVVVHYIIKHD